VKLVPRWPFDAQELTQFRNDLLTNPVRGGLIRPKIQLSRQLSRGTALTLIVKRVVSRRNRRVLDTYLPRLREVDEIKLGRARTGRRAFRWTGEVGTGRKAKPLGTGVYLLTLELRDRRGRVVSTSETKQIVIRRGKLAPRPLTLDPLEVFDCSLLPLARTFDHQKPRSQVRSLHGPSSPGTVSAPGREEDNGSTAITRRCVERTWCRGCGVRWACLG
jgi:hypothetical protein